MAHPPLTLKADLRVNYANADRVIVQARGGDDKLTAIGDVPGVIVFGRDAERFFADTWSFDFEDRRWQASSPTEHRSE